MLLWVAWDSFEFENACCVYRYSFPNPCAFYARSYYAPLWCDLCTTSAYNVSSCPFYACYTHLDLSLREPFGYAANFGMNYDLCGLEDTLDRVYNLVSTLLEGYRNLFVDEASSSLSYETVIPNLLEHAHVSTFSSQPSSSPKYIYDVPNDIF